MTKIDVKELIKGVPKLHAFASWLLMHVKRKRGSWRLKRLAKIQPVKLIIGASGVGQTGWISTDIEYLNLLNRKHWEKYFEKNSINAILAERVWEHLSIHEGAKAAQNCFDYLRPGGYLRIAVPDGFHPDEDYIRAVEPGGTGAGADDHKILFNHDSLKNLFQNAGFHVQLLEYFDSDGTFNFTDWNPENGKINRSIRFDERNKDGSSNYTSIILDAYK